MSLLDDMVAIDFTAVVDAKGLVSTALQSPDLQNLIQDGPARSVMGDLGRIAGQLDGELDDPAVLIAPIAGAMGSIASNIRFDNSDVARAVEVVGDAARIIADALGPLNGDLREVKAEGVGIGQLFENAGSGVGDFAERAVGAIGRRRAIFDAVERGMPTDPSALSDIALDILLPFPRDQLSMAKGQLATALQGLDRLTVPRTRVDGLISLLVEVRVAAESGNAAEVQAALDRLAPLRQSTIAQIAEDIRRAGQALSSLRLDQGLRAVAQASDALKTAEIGAIEELEEWRERLSGVEALIGQFDATQVRLVADELLDFAEAELARTYEAEVDLQVERLEAWLRGLLDQLPLREIRGKVTKALTDAARAIEEAELDSVARTVRGGIADLSDVVASIDLQAVVDDAIVELAGAIRAALDQIESALAGIVDAINAVIAQAQSVLQQAVDGVRTFRQAVDEVTGLIAAADIPGATQAVIETLGELRVKVEQLLAAAPLPEQMRPLVEQLAAEVESIDVEGLVRAPLMNVAETLRIPDDVAATIEDGLSQIAGMVENLIPDNIAAELQGELDGLFDQLSDLDLSGLLGGLSDEIDRLADLLEGIDVIAAAQPASEGFDTVIAGLDRLKPSRLLKPAIDAYDSVLGQLPTPDPVTIGERAGSVVSTAGETVGRAATAPVRAAAGEDARGDPTRQAGAPAESADPPPEGLRPGDILRLIGFLPAKLKEALEALEDGPAGEAMRTIQSLCADLAADVRRLQRAITTLDAKIEADLDDMLSRLARAQAEAQIAVNANFAVSGGPVDVTASGRAVGSLDATGLRDALAAELRFIDDRAREARRALAGGVGARLDDIAATLEGCALARFGDDLSQLLDALDPEPLAAQLDRIFALAIEAAEAVLGDIEADLAHIEQRVRRLLQRFNPAAQAQKLLRALNVLREQLNLFDPRRLAAELDEIHAAIRAAVAAYDPEVFARDLDALIKTTAASVRGLDPASLTLNFGPIETEISRLTDILPINALQAVGDDLDALGAELTAIDVGGLVAEVNEIPPQIAEAVADTAAAVKDEIQALLGAIRYANANASASVSVSAGVG